MKAYTPTKLITDSPETFDRWSKNYPGKKSGAVVTLCGTIMFYIVL